MRHGEDPPHRAAFSHFVDAIGTSANLRSPDRKLIGD
jgi:hypothetical protein